MVTGVSVGSINALGYSLFDKGQEAEADEFITKHWKNITNQNVYKKWDSFNPIHGILSEGGYFDSSPLYEWLTNLTQSRQMKKRLVVSSLDVHNGQYRDFKLFGEKNMDLVVNAVMASAAMPFVFPPVNMHKFGLDALLIDGGSTWNSNIVSGINECLSMPNITYKSQIEIDIIMLHPSHLTP